VPKKVGKQRWGRGFSREELKKAGTSLAEAIRLGIPVDARRKTAHEENVECAKGFLESKKATRKPKRKPKNRGLSN
jgi:large subunit ribosomal protein L13e